MKKHLILLITTIGIGFLFANSYKIPTKAYSAYILNSKNENLSETNKKDLEESISNLFSSVETSFLSDTIETSAKEDTIKIPTGINLSENAYSFSETTNEGKADYTTTILPIENIALFESMIQTNFGKVSNRTIEDSISNSIYMWNDKEVAIIKGYTREGSKCSDDHPYNEDEEGKDENYYQKRQDLISACEKKINFESKIKYAKSILNMTPGKNKMISEVKSDALFSNYYNVNYAIDTSYIKQTPTNSMWDIVSNGNVIYSDNKIYYDLETSANEELLNIKKIISNRKFNKKYLKYINEDKLIFALSAKINTEALYNNIPKVVKLMGEETKIAPELELFSDLATLYLDEKTIAKADNGDYLFLVHDLKNKTVSYTEFEFDEETGDSKEVEKEKQEAIPDFTYIASYKDDSFYKSLIRYGERRNAITAKGNIRTLAFPFTKFGIRKKGPYEKIYILLKDNIVFVSSSEDYINSIENNSFRSKVSKEIKTNLKHPIAFIYNNNFDTSNLKDINPDDMLFINGLKEYSSKIGYIDYSYKGGRDATHRFEVNGLDENTTDVIYNALLNIIF